MIIVVGIGADGMAGLGAGVAAELRRATVIYGSQRQLDLLDDTVSAPRRRVAVADAACAAHAARRRTTDDIHVVASGDPLLHGVGGTLIRLYGAEQVTVLPHVSSVTLACARMGWAVQDTEVISLVTAGRTPRYAAAGRRSCCPATARPRPSWPRCSPTLAAATREITRARTTRRPGRAPPRRPPRGSGRHDPPARRRRSQCHRRALPARRAAVRRAARRRIRPRRADHQAADPRGDAGGARAAARASCCGTSGRVRAASRSSGAGAGRVARRWRSNATSSAVPTSDRATPRRSASSVEVRGRRAGGVRRRPTRRRRSSSAAA